MTSPTDTGTQSQGTVVTAAGMIGVSVNVGVAPVSPPADVRVPRLKSKIDLTDNATLLAVYCFIKNFIGASGTSTVAIDNKIEQAMDLVKSHLMFAVREEVEVLKEKISELMDRINQLEYENGILKANASQETLAQLTSQQPPKSQQPPGGPPPSSVS